MRKQRVLVLGAGISGLSAAWSLRQRGYEVQVLEASGRAGGWLRSTREEGFLFERGPRGFRPRGQGLYSLELVHELDLQGELISADLGARRRYILRNGKLCLLPLNRLRLGAALLRDCFTRRGGEPAESVYAFFRRRFGAHIAENYCQAIVTGIFAGDAEQLALSACFPQLYQWEGQHRSITKAMLMAKRKRSSILSQFQKAPLCSFRNGMETLTQRLAERLGDVLELNCEVLSMSSTKDEITAHCANGSFSADYIVSTLPAKELKHNGLALVCCAYDDRVLPQRGFGYLVPPQEPSSILGMVWDSEVFPQQGQGQQQTRLTVMMGGARQPDSVSESDAVLKARALNAIATDLGIDRAPSYCSVFRARAAIPQYNLDYPNWKENKLLSSQREHPRLKLLGTSFRGVAVNDCIAAGRQLDLKADSH